MAYAFSKINKLIDDKQPTTNIFGEGQTGLLVQDNPEQTGGSGVTKTDTSGDLSGGGQGGSSGFTGSGDTSANSDNQGQSSEARTRIFRANTGKTELPQGINRIRDKIEANNQSLQDMANDYRDQYKEDYDYGVDNDSITKAIEGDQGAYDQVGGLLSKQQADYRPEFEGADDLYVDQMKYLDNNAGLAKMASEGQGPRYSRGMGTFDAMLMQQDPDFSKIVREIKGGNSRLEKQLNTLPDELEEEAKAYGDENLESAQSQAEEAIRNYQTDLKSQNEAEVQAYLDKLAAMDQDAINAEALKNAQAGLRGELEQYYSGRDFETSILPYLQDAGIDPSEFVNFDSGDYTYRDFVDETEAGRFNKILGLLGDGGDAYTAAKGPGDMYTVDESGLTGTLRENVLRARELRDREQLAAADAIESAAAKRARLDNERRIGLLGSYDADLQAKAQAIAGGLDGDLARFYDQSILEGYGGSAPNAIKNAHWDQALTAEEAAKLNAIAADLGQSASYEKGSFADGGRKSFIDDESLKNYLVDQMTQRMMANEAANEVAKAANEAQARHDTAPAPDGTLNVDMDPVTHVPTISNGSTVDSGGGWVSDEDEGLIMPGSINVW